ncbi:hypothetical protein [Microvirga massiliensis]|uniref:hypothetical protein n=1 Tax=Microvirga massiliensis TaxID=1033741 RepID=UPI00062B7424|nr:hypothetical protein [Microvirga massiliensis]
MKKILIALALLAAGPATADSVTLDSANLACANYSDARKLSTLAGDVEAFGKFMRQKKRSGDCKEIQSGVELFLDKYVGHLHCIRPRGEIECWWASLGGSDAEKLRHECRMAGRCPL